MFSLKKIVSLTFLLCLISLAGADISWGTIHNISIIDFQFIPQTDTVVVGDTVRWTNNGSFPHTSTSNTGVWNSGTLSSGQSFSFQFTSSGSYPYHCTIHPSMTGTIVVIPQVTVHQISIIDFDFVPQTDTITAGDSVRWTNNGSVQHTSTSDTGVWDSSLLNPGQSFAFLFTTPGSYPYHCTPHPFMTGSIFVSSNTCGDTNGDGQVSVSDVVYLINYLFKGGPAPYPFQNADANGDAQVSVSDVVYLINYLFKGGNPPIC